jgi:hypothetical protein
MTWAITWDDLSIDGLVNLTAVECEDTLRRLQDGSSIDNVTRLLRMMMLRSRLNGHRSPEVWVFDSDEGVSEDQIRDWFRSAPDAAKALIRAKGIKQSI